MVEDDHWADDLVDSVLPPITLQIGKRYMHPEDGVIEITSGCYRDATYGRVSNFWYWTTEAGETHNGYGANWPEVTKMRDTYFLHGASEPDGIDLVGGTNFTNRWGNPHSRERCTQIEQEYRDQHAKTAHMRKRPVKILAFGVDHGLGAHSGNGGKWRTTVVALVELEYLKSKPETWVRLEGEVATELLAQLAEAVAIRERKV